MYFYYVLDLRVLYFALRRMLDHMISRGPSQSELPYNLTTFLWSGIVPLSYIIFIFAAFFALEIKRY